MKQIFRLSIVALVLICTFALVADAKTRRHHNSSSSIGIPSPRVFDDLGMYIDKPKKVKQKTGLTCLYKYTDRPCSDNHYFKGGCYAYGKNAKLASKRDLTFTATGPHAFVYIFSNDFSNEWWSYNFSDQADRDKFWNEMASNGEDMSWYLKGYDKGWYTISWNP